MVNPLVLSENAGGIERRETHQKLNIHFSKMDIVHPDEDSVRDPHYLVVYKLSLTWRIKMKTISPLTVKLNPKGQITIPWRIRQRLGIQGGDELEIRVENTKLVILSKPNHKIETVFGILKAKVSVSLEEMETVIRHRAGRSL